MSIVKFIKSLFAKRNEHVESVKQIDKEIAEVLYKVGKSNIMFEL